MISGPHKAQLYRVAVWLLYGLAAVWAVLSAVTLARAQSDSLALAAGLTVMMLGNAAVLAIGARGLQTGLGLRNGRRLFRYLVLALVTLNIVLTFTDQVGALDIATVLPDLAIVVLLIAAGPPERDAG